MAGSSGGGPVIRAGKFSSARPLKRARIEIIPMIDIMLFLLVFFVMLTLKMIPTTGHTTKLPVSSTAESLPVDRKSTRLNSSHT